MGEKTAFERIMYEFDAHPKKSDGFKKEDLESFTGDERRQVSDRLLREVEEGCIFILNKTANVELCGWPPAN